MGRYCRICDKVRSNESFSVGGHKNCICKRCQKLPKEKRRFISAKEELLGFWNQSNISALNIKSIEQLKRFPSEDIQNLAHLTFEVATAKPHKKRRMRWLRNNHPDLFYRVTTYFRCGYDDDEEGKEILQETAIDDERCSFLETHDCSPF